MDYQGRQRLVNYYGIVENVNFILFGKVNVGDRRECPNCFVMFKKKRIVTAFQFKIRGHFYPGYIMTSVFL